jgi:trehalose 6-phosphate phosphatase
MFNTGFGMIFSTTQPESLNNRKMTRADHVEPQLKVFGIDQVIAVLKNEKIYLDQLSAWNRKQVKTSIVQSEKDMNLSFIKKQLKRDLDESDISIGRTMIISDVPRVISILKGKKVAMILGLKEEGQEHKPLYESGADVVVNSLKDIVLVEGNASSTSITQNLPSAFYELSKFPPALAQSRPLFFFDYDGTLAPITRDPSQAYLPEETRKLLAQLAGKFRVAIVSGRDMDDLKQFIRLDSLIYAGSHGFRISGPGGIEMEHEKVGELLPRMNTLMDLLQKEPELKIRGVEIERKFMAIAVHYRNAPSGTYKTVYNAIKKVISSYDEFRAGRGKKVIEIRPSLEWHKGRAVEWIMQALEQKDGVNYMPIYLGDDITDEDAFRSMPKNGIGILVGEHPSPSAACCQLPDVWEVQKLLNYLVRVWQG